MPAIPYFRNSKRTIALQYLIPAFLMEENHSRTLVLLFEQYNTPATP